MFRSRPLDTEFKLTVDAGVFLEYMKATDMKLYEHKHV